MKTLKILNVVHALFFFLITFALTNCGQINAPAKSAAGNSSSPSQTPTASDLEEIPAPAYMALLTPNPNSQATPPTVGQANGNLYVSSASINSGTGYGTAKFEPTTTQKQALQDFLTACKASLDYATMYSAVSMFGVTNNNAVGCNLCQVSQIQKNGTIVTRNFVPKAQGMSCLASLVKPGATVGAAGAIFAAAVAVPQIRGYAGVVGIGGVAIDTLHGIVSGCGAGFAGYAAPLANIYGYVSWAPACFAANYLQVIGF